MHVTIYFLQAVLSIKLYFPLILPYMIPDICMWIFGVFAMVQTSVQTGHEMLYFYSDVDVGVV